MFGSHILLPRLHLVCIAPDGIDLAVVYDEAVGMRALPAGVGIGAESGMHHGNGRFIIFILQVCEEGTQLSYQEHSFVYDGPAGHGYHISIVIALLEYTAGNVETAVKLQTFLHIFRFFDKCLYDMRHTFQCFMSQNFGINRDFPVA